MPGRPIHWGHGFVNIPAWTSTCGCCSHARALAEEGSFARAARTLHLTQPALSRSIQELERRTGIKLFDRNQGRVELTDLGGVFLAHARELLGHAEALNQRGGAMRGTGTGSLVVGSGTFPTEMFMAEAVSAFLRQATRGRIRLQNENWAGLVAKLRRRELDFIVAAHPPPKRPQTSRSSLVAAARRTSSCDPAHPLVAKRELSVADIVAYPMVGSARFSSPLMPCCSTCGGTPMPTGTCPKSAANRTK